ncbi:pPIWI_RE module domain-containing protein [Streptomyces sp. NPDC020141]|uniref:pPIWI_RE module domain-containing protein n=1 Tax=Streptomyces sp. NPDC020141 TaxID=3365065 RepID=UPI00378C52D2
MTRYDTIRLAGYVPDPDAEWTVPYYTLALPRPQRKLLLDLYRLGLKRPDDCLAVPVGRLNSLLQALAPEVVSVAKWLDVSNDEPWLYARGPVPADVFATLVHAWVNDLRPEPEHRQAVREALDALGPGELRWERCEVPMLARTPTTAGTAQPDERLYQMLPDALAGLALGLDPFSYPGGSLGFRGVARRPSDRGAELLSWPPDRYEDRDGRTWWFSALLTLTLQTVPFSPEFRVHLRSGVRRWATRTGPKGLYLPPRRAASVYLLANAPWIDDSPESRGSTRFSVGRLRYDRTLRARRWEAGGPGGILSRLRLRQPFPQPDSLIGDPAHWLAGAGGVTAAVVHSTPMGSHGVKAGLMPGDRVPLTEWFEQALPGGLRRAPDPVRANRWSTVRKPAGERTGDVPAPDTRETAELRKDMAALLAGEPFRAEFLWLSTPVRDAGVQALATLFGLSGEPVRKPAGEASNPDGETLSWQTPELTVELRLARIGGLADSFALSPAEQGRTSALHAAIADRRAQVVQRLPATPAEGRASFALLEIHPKDAYIPRSADPKFALRLGFRDAGRVTQFVTNPRRVPGKPADADKARAKKLEACWTEGFRQLGHRAVPTHGLGPKIPADTQYAALWLVKRRRDGPTRRADLVPVAVRVRPGDAAPERITGWDVRTGEWVPYPALLMRLAASAELPTADDLDEEPPSAGTGGPAGAEDGDAPDQDEEWNEPTERHRRIVADAVQEVLFGLRDRPTLLLVHAQNARQLWPWLQDGHIEPDRLRIHGRPAQRLTIQGPGLRLVRVRESTDTETPQWWGHGPQTSDDGEEEEEERFGIATGLWRPPGHDPRNRVFGSTGEKAGPGTNVSVMASRWAFRSYTRKGKTGSTIDTDRPAWNPGLLEIVVAGCQADDDPELWATLTHRLRQSPGRSPLLALPLPLHLVRKATEYVLPTTRDDPMESQEDDAAVQLCFDLGVIAP